MIDLAEAIQLDWRHAARLYVRLQRLSSFHGIRRSIEGYERAGNPVKTLERIRKSLDMLAKFSKSLLTENAGPSERMVEKKLENAAHFWADDVRRESEKPGQYERWEEAKAFGFEHSSAFTDPNVSFRNFDPAATEPSARFHNYDAYLVVRTWLRCNVLFSKLAAEIINEAYKPAPASDWISAGEAGDPSAAQHLASVELPRLYESLTGKRYGFSMGRDGTKLNNSGGPKFVAMCYPVMGLPKPSLDTLRTHWRSWKTGEAARANLGPSMARHPKK